MQFIETKLKGAFLIQVDKLEDNRGYFATTFSIPEFESHQLNTIVRQTSTSFNKLRGTIRGMHFQLPPYAETKLVRCIQGSIFDVIVDLRPGSATYSHWVGYELSSQNMNMLYIPEGFAHGYQTLADKTEVSYQLGQIYSPQHARGIRFDDPQIVIEWILPLSVISDRDRTLPYLKELTREGQVMLA